MNAIRAIRGMNDILPGAIGAWQHVERHARDLLEAYGYEEVRPPMVERTELFRRSIGEVTDIVEKEMYTFDDRNGESLTLRPECTASVVRAAIEHGLLRTPGRRVWTMGPMFRYERPQKGRYRQFHQIDVEIFGVAAPSAEAELIVLTRRLWKTLGVAGLALELNSLGSRDIQARYRARLVEYFSAHSSALDADSQRRIRTNPLRILDSKNPAMQGLIEKAPRIVEELDDDARAHFDELLAMLDEAGVAYRLNHRLVRGLDYYTGTVFEWTTDELGAQGAVCGGGRYDNLVAEIGGPATPAIGFAIGLERLVALLEAQSVELPAAEPHAYLASAGTRASVLAHAVAERLRDAVPELRLVVDAGPGSFKAKLKRADRCGARIALLLGEEEARIGRVAVKDLRAREPQSTVAIDELAGHVARNVFAG
ncbi:MAG: histidine--tRNA ligase [Chromatiales bacterium]|nr:histidine--tRNA ligase [Chromatiales bacterium]